MNKDRQACIAANTLLLVVQSRRKLNLKTNKEKKTSSSSTKPTVSSRVKYDFSTKPFEVLCKEYRFDKYIRKIKNEPKWVHYKYYQTFEGANDAMKAFRNSWYDKVYRDYPSMGNIKNEAKYPHIKPTITVKRYFVIKRDFDKPYR